MNELLICILGSISLVCGSILYRIHCNRKEEMTKTNETFDILNPDTWHLVNADDIFHIDGRDVYVDDFSERMKLE